MADATNEHRAGKRADMTAHIESLVATAELPDVTAQMLSSFHPSRIHTNSFYIVVLDECGAFDPLSGLTGSHPWQLRCLLALVVQVAVDFGALRRQKKLGF
jgi:hypothetical protein